jgi:hypothetical protein
VLLVPLSCSGNAGPAGSCCPRMRQRWQPDRASKQNAKKHNRTNLLIGSIRNVAPAEVTLRLEGVPLLEDFQHIMYEEQKTKRTCISRLLFST